MIKRINQNRDAIVFYGAMFLALSLVVSDWWTFREPAEVATTATQRAS